MSILIKNGVIADGEGIFIENGSILVDYGRIQKIAEHIDTDGVDEVIDAGGRLIMPGLTNPHHHLYSALATGLAPKGPTPDFVHILENLWWHLDKVMDPEMVYASAMAGLMESVRSGVTMIFDHHASMSYVRGSLDTMAQAFKVSGVRGLLCFEASDRTGEKNTEEHILENVEFFKKNRIGAEIQGAFGLHANMTLCERSMEKIAEAKPADMAIHAHVAEDKADAEYCRKLGYKGALDRLDKFCLVYDRSIIIHAIHLDDSEYDIIKEKKPIVVNNSESNANNNVGKMNRERIGDFVLGTDGMTGDMIASLRSHFLLDQNPGGFAGISDRFFRQTYRAKKTFFPNNRGLFTNSQADIAIFDYIPQTPINADNLLGHIIFGAKKGNAWLTMCDGRILWHDGEFKLFDQNEVMRDIQKHAKRLHNAFNA